MESSSSIEISLDNDGADGNYDFEHDCGRGGRSVFVIHQGNGIPNQAAVNAGADAMNPYMVHRQEDEEEASYGDDRSDTLRLEKLVFPVANDHGKPSKYPSNIASAAEVGEEKDDEDDDIPKRRRQKDEGDATAMIEDNVVVVAEREQEEDSHSTSPPSRPSSHSHSVIGSGIECLKYLYSMGLLAFCVTLVTAGMFQHQTQATGPEGNLPPVAAFFLFWFLIAWLAIMEGGQGCLVGLQPVDRERYARSHPLTHRCATLAQRGDNMERFIVGRQFLVVLVVFLSNLMASAIPDATVLNLGPVATEIFLSSGLALILTTIVIGQLTAQVNAANCMLDFVNNYFMLFTTYLSLAIEWSGLLHSAYLVQIVFARLAAKPIESNEPRPRTAFQSAFFWGRVLASLAVLGWAFAVTLSALFQGQTAMWARVPQVVSVVLFFVLMCFVGMLEGMQIALFAVVNLPEEELRQHVVAARNCKLTFTGQNLQAFLIGRQICVTVCMFVVARITTIHVAEGEPTVLGVSPGLQSFFNTGLLGAVITTIVGSLVWRVVASSFPLAFLSNPVIYLIVRLCLLLEKSGLCSSAWVLARYHKPLVGYQPDEVYLDGAEPHGAGPVTRRDKDIDRLVAVVKYAYSLALLLFCLVLVMVALFTNQTHATATMGVPAAAAFFIFWFLIAWLGMMEGGQGALVGLRPVAEDLYAGSHPRTAKNTRLAHRGDNMERFIVGRQFLVVLVVFVTNLMATALPDASVLGLPKVVSDIFLVTGIALILVTITVGQLTAQVNAANCMLDFLNNYFMLFTTYVSLAIEFSGLLHSVYLVQILFSKITGRTMDSNEPPRGLLSRFWFWSRVLLSLAVLGIALAVTLQSLFQGQTAMWDGVPAAASVVIFFVLMCFVGMMEGMQIALFAVVNLPREELESHGIAYGNCQLAFAQQNLQAFLIGRQICVTICMFVVARITTITVDVEAGEQTIFGVSAGLQSFFNTGLLGAVITTLVGSLMWRIVASSFPVAFLSNPLICLIIRLCLLLEASGLCSSAWVLGRWNFLIARFQPDEVYLEGAPSHGKAPVTHRDKDIDVTVTVIKYAYSMALLVFSVTLVMASIFNQYTKVSADVSPWLAVVVLWLSILWLAMMEGGQGCLVGLYPVDKELYRESHKVSYKCTVLAHRGDNMERFIVGRQFLVVLVVFVSNLCGGVAAATDVQLFNLPNLVVEIFVTSGLSLILMTIVLGQLSAQVNAANSMLDFTNTYFMLFTTYVSLAIEFSGLLHSVYLVQVIFSNIAGKPIQSNEPRPRSALQGTFFWGRVVLSLAVLAFAFAVTLFALFNGQTTMWPGVPDAVSVVVFFVLMCFVGMMEGMQIALFAVVNLPEGALQNHRLAEKTCQLTFRGRNLQAFLIGRQICVTICMFVVARITTLNVDVEAGDPTVFGVPAGLQNFFNTGLLGAVITTVVASLSWRIVASSFPVAFLSNPLVYAIVRLCLLLEATGLCSSAWLLALIHEEAVGFQSDESYIGTPEERAAAATTASAPSKETTDGTASGGDDDDEDNDLELGMDGGRRPRQRSDKLLAPAHKGEERAPPPEDDHRDGQLGEEEDDL